ncbi:MAG: glycosyltransferase [Spirochaeta sp.]|nr:glycosyltransferase [Spirochaeta sp.]
MKTIALSCTGEGFGHAARTVALAEELRKTCRLVIFCPPHLFPFMRQHLSDVPLEEIPYFSFVKFRDRIDYARTVYANLPALIRFPVSVRRIVSRLRRYRVSALISDYDPFGSAAAKALGVPVLQINHPAVVLRQREFSLQSLLAKIVSVLLMGTYQRKLVVSFYNGDVGPVVRRSIVAGYRSAEDFFVVYVKPTYRDSVLQALSRQGVTKVHVFPDPQKRMADYLGRCRAVISSAGHQFMSEALVLGKPIFVVPQAGQYEQLLNARMLARSGRGEWARLQELDERLATFIGNIDQYPLHRPGTGVRYRFDNDLDRAVAKILQFLDQTVVPARPRKLSWSIGTPARPIRHVPALPAEF